MFRRFRVKTGEEDVLDADGNVTGKRSVFGRVWKRKVVDAKTGDVSWQTINLKDYSFGRGVYRSSYKNAMRLARTETNMAYRSAEQDRWRRMDFILGYRVVMSDNHPAHDICDDLSAKRGETGNKGTYPKDFVFKGWHPQCRCYVVPIIADDDEFDRMQEAIAEGKEPDESENMIREPNSEFRQWWADNKQRVASAQSLPYWVKDNPKFVGEKIKRAKSSINEMLQEQDVNSILKSMPTTISPITQTNNIADFDKSVATAQKWLESDVLKSQSLEVVKQAQSFLSQYDDFIATGDFVRANNAIKGFSNLHDLINENVDFKKVSMLMPKELLPKGKWLQCAKVEFKKEFFDLLSEYVPVNITENIKAGYRPFLRSVTLGTGDSRYDKGVWFQIKSVYHEFGHAIDQQRNLSANSEILNIMKKYDAEMRTKASCRVFNLNATNKDDLFIIKMVEPYECVDDMVKESNKVIHSIYLSLQDNEEIVSICKKLRIKPNRLDAGQRSAFLDTINALSKGQYGEGHSAAYWAQPNAPAGEFIAHCFEIKYAGNMFFRWADRKLYYDMINTIEKVLN